MNDTSSTANHAAPWWEGFYDHLLAAVLLENTDPGEIAKTVSFLRDKLALSPGDRVFDQCCGNGRLSIPLAEAGYRVLGIDLIEGYVEAARVSAEASASNPTFEAADAFDFSCTPACSAALNWWTSFGYSPNDSDNIQMLERAFESIVPSGWFALDFMNVPGVLRHFQPQVVTRGHSENEGEILLIRDSAIDVANGMMNKEWTYHLESGRRVRHHSSVRIYDPPTLTRLFELAGFVDISVYGDLDASPITLESPRCIVVGQRPED